MIVPMKKVFIITQAKDASQATRALRSIGVVHVEHQQPPKGSDVASIQDDLALIERAVTVLSEPGLKTPARFSNIRHLRDWKFAARYIIDQRSRLDQLGEFSSSLMNKIIQWEKWGDFDPGKIRALKEKGIHVGLYLIDIDQLEKLPREVVVEEVFRVNGISGCALISRKGADIPFKELALPPMALGAMRARLAEDKVVMENLIAALAKCKRYRDRFLRIGRAFEKELEIHEAVRGMASSGVLAYLAGYVPFDKVDAALEAARKEQWGIVVKDPSDDDNVPTLVRNPRWISIIAPVFKVVGLVPGYRELDISLWFLLFFSVFFGMIIGDAAYGAIFMAVTFWAQRKFGKNLRNNSAFILMYVLSGCAVIWGVLSGTFFGQEWHPQSIKPLIPALRNDKNVQTLCFLLGSVHLSIAHVWRAILKAPSIAALGDIGWTVVLWGVFFLARLLILGEVFPAFAKWFFIVGPIMVVFFAEPKRNVFKTVGSGLGTLALNFMNTFTDVVSYVRLFAVGLAGVAIADAFNKLALDIGFGSVLAGLVTALILFLGHALNIVLGPMSVLVHGIRLNVLEFCGHVDVKWSGFGYKPLREEKAGVHQ